ncbi:MFS transporter [Desulfobotulus mexicanus]|uniref:MFS transporter n=1 Tax=Desulfobotulus mexicanus TaxID=2586642 RepID=A0A5S5MC66_9BACT|nr:MFS transporter [Desulfobotulus mexicanus]TYT73302.1 MFS transporter [Desulfobotulus mexicanus]
MKTDPKIRNNPPEEKASPSLTQTLCVAGTASLAIFMVNLDATVVNIVLPEISSLFGIRTSEASIFVLSYLLALTGTALIFGRLSDMKGPEKIFFLGYAVFVLGSLLCAFSWNVWSLALFRFVQGLGGAMIFATNAVIVIRYLPEKIRGRAFAFNGMMAGIGFALGSPVGGFLSHHFDWRMVFLVNIPVGLAGLFLGMYWLKKRELPAIRGSFDKAGAITSFLCLCFLVFSLHSWEESLLFSPEIIGGLAIALVAGFLFLKYQKKSDHPLMPLSLFRNAPLNFALAGTACYYILLQGLAIVFPFYFIDARGMTAFATGNLLFISPMISMLITPLAGWLCDRIGSRIPAMGGALLFIVSCIFFLNLTPASSTVWLMSCLVLYGLAMGFYCAPILTLTMSHARPETSGVLSSVKSVLPSIFGMLSVGIYATLYSTGESAGGIMEQAASQQGFQTIIWVSLGVSLFCFAVTFLSRDGRSEP